MVVSLRRPASSNGLVMGEGVYVEPVPVGRKRTLRVPTGKCVIKKRGGGPAPCAAASMSRSSTFSPNAPPTPAKNERRAKRYDLIERLLWNDLRTLRRSQLP